MDSTHPASIRRVLKRVADVIALLLASPAGALCALERWLSPASESVFLFFVHLVALLPGVPGLYLRRAFYKLALDRCDLDCYIGFGAQFTHRDSVVEHGVYVGSLALIGSAHLREGTLIGSRASLLSGTSLHDFRDGRWTPFDRGQIRQVQIGPHAFVGEGAIVMADVGPGAMVAAGAVVANMVPAGVAVAGNPARFVRHLVRGADEACTLRSPDEALTGASR
jgi:virginiamycin A acetyltransferase